jgi:hypothetical protein
MNKFDFDKNRAFIPTKTGSVPTLNTTESVGFVTLTLKSTY